MQKLIGDPVNEMQEVFNDLCEKGGGAGGGPARTRVQAIIREFGQQLNHSAYGQMEEALGWVPEANPWHVSFAMGLCWGTIAKHEKPFFVAATGALASWNDRDRKEACRHHLEKGWDLLEGSLLGGHRLFEDAHLRNDLPDDFEAMEHAQRRWLRSLEKLAPRYIGPWNSLAVFMSALFARPELASAMRNPPPLLPPGGPISAGLWLLHRARVIDAPPNTEHDDENFASLSAAVIDNHLMHGLLHGLPDCSMVDVHTGIYLLGTRDRRSRKWLENA